MGEMVHSAFVDTGSEAYRAGSLAGYIFLGLLALLLLRKLLRRD